MSTPQADVVVVGAGGGGAVLGLALARQGVSVLVLERAPGPPSGLRGEILQPNGQAILARLGVLDQLPPSTVKPVRHFHFCRAGGARLCSIDYGMLPAPYNRALVTLPNAAHHAILAAFERQAPGRLFYDTRVQGVQRQGSTVTGVVVERQGVPCSISARVVVGADGAFSPVRQALGIPSRVHRYREGYLIGMLDDPQGIEDAQYFVGHRTILGAFPAAGRRMFVFYMIPADSLEAVRALGLDLLRDRWRGIAPQLSRIFDSLRDWSQIAYLPTARVRAARWVADGAVLIGDAAHAMNPHASQGRMQAMEDALALADLIPACLARGDCSAAALAPFELARRQHVEMLQRLADEQVFFWNTGNPVVAFLRDRVFRTLDRNPRLRYQVLCTTAGLRRTPPFGWLDRLMAAGFLPDRRSNVLPPEATRMAC